MPPVKEAALRLGLTVHQPERVRRPEVVEQLRAMAPEAMVVVGYGQIIPQSILDIPPHGIINVHASLLPKYRGAAPIQWAIARGESHTGVTTMRINAGLDTGDMLLKWETEIGDEETAVDLGARLAGAGADLLVRTLKELGEHSAGAAGRFAGDAGADPEQRRRAYRLDDAGARNSESDARISCPGRDATDSCAACDFTSGRRAGRDCTGSPVKLRYRQRRLFAGCGDGSIELLEVQLEGKKRMTAAAFLNGNSIEEGEHLQ